MPPIPLHTASSTHSAPKENFNNIATQAAFWLACKPGHRKLSKLHPSSSSKEIQ